MNGIGLKTPLVGLKNGERERAITTRRPRDDRILEGGDAGVQHGLGGAPLAARASLERPALHGYTQRELDRVRAVQTRPLLLHVAGEVV